MADIQKRREREKTVVSEMIALYCRRNHRQKAICPDCAALLAYAIERSDRCPHMESKTFCSSCKTHCYRQDMRDQIRTVMRYSGPRMMTVHPVLAIRHLIESRIEKKNMNR